MQNYTFELTFVTNLNLLYNGTLWARKKRIYLQWCSSFLYFIFPPLVLRLRTESGRAI